MNRAGSSFDPEVERALEKWPNVPACYGWLGLDRRGRWLIKGEAITHSGAINFLSRNYDVNESGCWFVQNGPQRAFCSLEYTPWIYSLDSTGIFKTHTNEAIERIESFIVDDEGNLLLHSEHGIGLVDDRDLPSVTENLSVFKSGDIKLDQLLDYEFLSSSINSHESHTLKFSEQAVPVKAIAKNQIAKLFNFINEPTA